MAVHNPYVGPAALSPNHRIYGRKAEIGDLRDLLIAERLVLLYSPSGAGKTSLIQAGLLRELREKEGFRVCLIRGFRGAQGKPNRYLKNVYDALEDALPEAVRKRRDTAASLDEYLKGRPRVATEGPPDVEELVLIFDQFEEIFNIDPVDRDAKAEFFRELGRALRDRTRWALFSMREDHVAALDDYLHLLPTQLKTRFRLGLLERPQAQQAIEGPLGDLCGRGSDKCVNYEVGAAELIISDLCQVRQQTETGDVKPRQGHVIEPVQLQVVCYRLWEHRFPQGCDPPATISKADVRAVSVDSALEDFFADKAKAAALAVHVPERDVRDWVESKLITSQGLRGQVMWEPGKSGDLINDAIDELEDAHIVRLEVRGDRRWYELTHDRLLRPITDNNRAWRETNLTPFQRQAILWGHGGGPQLELRGAALREVERWAAAHRELTRAEQGLLKASQDARRLRRNKRLIFFGIPILLIAAIVSFEGYRSWYEAQPWGYLTSFPEGNTFELSGDVVSVGRSVEGPLRSQIPVRPNVVSRLHLMVSREDRAGQLYLRAYDMRSLNGTTVNARFVRYGQERDLFDGDLVTLAGVALFRFSTVEPSYLPFLQKRPVEPPPIPQGAWAVLVDGASREAIPLIGERYYLAAGPHGALNVSEQGDDRTLLAIGRRTDGQPTLTSRTKSYALLMMMKYEDRTYVAIEFPYGETFEAPLRDESGKEISGSEYASKMSFCLSHHTRQAVTIIKRDDDPPCVVGPFQIMPM